MEKNPLIFAIISGFDICCRCISSLCRGSYDFSRFNSCFPSIATKLIPNAVPAVDCAVFFPYAPTAVIVDLHLVS